ncbi:MAG: hypothetical protein AAF961_02050 [Planctomycetota bacterium]
MRRGEGCCGDGSHQGRRRPDFAGGLSNAIALVQTNDAGAVVWIKREDRRDDAQKPLSVLTPTPHPGIFLAALADASVPAISEGIDVDVFRDLLSVTGGKRRGHRIR